MELELTRISHGAEMLGLTTERRGRAPLCVTEPGGRNNRHVSPRMGGTEEACDDTSKSEAHNNNRRKTDCHL
jgi:hypothetical protein